MGDGNLFGVRPDTNSRGSRGRFPVRLEVASRYTLPICATKGSLDRERGISVATKQQPNNLFQEAAPAREPKGGMRTRSLLPRRKPICFASELKGSIAGNVKRR